jgi:hypothetical protein
MTLNKFLVATTIIYWAPFLSKQIFIPNIQLAKMFYLVATLCEGGGTLQCIYISFIANAHRGTWLWMKFEFCKIENATMQNDECWVIFRNYTKPPHIIGFMLIVHNHNSQIIKYKILIYQKIKYLIMIYNYELF